MRHDLLIPLKRLIIDYDTVKKKQSNSMESEVLSETKIIVVGTVKLQARAKSKLVFEGIFCFIEN